jgi:hypothetical protein
MPKQFSWKYLCTVHSNSACGKTKYGYFDDYGLRMLNIGIKFREKGLHITVTSVSVMAIEQP